MGERENRWDEIEIIYQSVVDDYSEDVWAIIRLEAREDRESKNKILANLIIEFCERLRRVRGRGIFDDAIAEAVVQGKPLSAVLDQMSGDLFDIRERFIEELEYK